MREELVKTISTLCGEDSRIIIDTLYTQGLLNNNSVRNYLIRKDFDKALLGGVDLIKHIFIDISDKYGISVRQAQRIVYDYMKQKVSVNGNTITN